MSAARAWLQRWQGTHDGSPLFRPATAEADGPSRIPRIILTTAVDPYEALANWGSRMRTWWTLNPEYQYVLLSDADCEAFLVACCPPEEHMAYSLLKRGAARADLFRAIFMREVGGVYADQDAALKQPLRLFIPAWASIVTRISNNGNWDFVWLAFEPSSPVWNVHVRRVVSQVLTQARFACMRDTRGCKGFWNCVQNVTGAPAFATSLKEVAERYGCRGVTLRPESCVNAKHGHLRRLVAHHGTELPIEHVPCHNKKGSRHPCIRPKENQTHYVSIPEASVNYAHTREGARYGSSAPGYFWPLCRDDAHRLY